MNSTSPIRSKTMNSTDNRYYFGAYLNMARHNAYMILKYLSEKYDLDKPYTKGKKTINSLSEESLGDCFLLGFLKDTTTGKPDVVESLVGDLKHYFPFLRFQDILIEEHKRQKVVSLKNNFNDLALKFNPPNKAAKAVENIVILDELKSQDYADLLCAFFKVLSELRNYNSHFIHEPIWGFDKTDTFFKIYDAALHRLMGQNKLNEKFSKKDIKYIESLKVSDSNKQAEKVPAEFTSNKIDEKSLAFFISLFLEPKYASLFLSRLLGFPKKLSEGEMSIYERIPLKIYTAFCCHLPQPKLESSDIMLDMLNELNRCPADLFPLICETDKKKRFRALIKDNEETASVDENSETSESERYVDLVRKNDRFSYFALRYFDDAKIFPTLRFQVKLGKILKKQKYIKTIYGTERERVLTNPIFSFCKLSPFQKKYEMVNQDDVETKNKIIRNDFVELFPESWKEKNADGITRLKAEIEQFSPRYNFNYDTTAKRETIIGFKIYNDEVTAKYQDENLPDLDALLPESPQAFISVYELRNLFFYQYLYIEHKKQRELNPNTVEDTIKISTDAETFLKEYIQNIKKFLVDVAAGRFLPLVDRPHFEKKAKLPFNPYDKDQQKLDRVDFRKSKNEMELRREQLAELVKKDYGIMYGSIPNDIREYLLGYKATGYGTLAKETFDAKRIEIEKLQKQITKDRLPRTGEIATWLAEDIVFMMPIRKYVAANGKKADAKLNNDQFRVLQASLAYFQENKPKIINFFEELGLIKSDASKNHPFLEKIDWKKCKYVSDFYEQYLSRKILYLEEAKRFIGSYKSPETKRNWQQTATDFSIRKEYGHLIKDDKKGRAKSYSNTPVLLPKGLFNEAIAQHINAEMKESFKTQIKATKKKGSERQNNVVFSLETYLNKECQDFYAYPHFYEDKQFGKLAEKSKYMIKIEKEIESVENEYTDKFGDKEKQDWKNKKKDLERKKDFVLEREQTIRYHQTNDRALWLMIKDRQKNADEHIDINFVNLELTNIKQILETNTLVKGKVTEKYFISATLPIRRYGDLRRVLKDRRLESLVKYYNPEFYDTRIADNKSVEIPMETIVKEFEQYDLRREKFFETIYRFEETIYKYFKTDFTMQLQADIFYDHKVFMQIAANKLSDTVLADHYKNKVIMFRNKANHNQIPDHTEKIFSTWLLNEVQNESTPLYCDKIFNIAECYYNKLLNQILPA